MNRFSAGCGCCEDCDWNGCTKPSALVISGSSTDGLFPNVDDTYPIANYTTTIAGNCSWYSIIYDSPSRRIEASVLLEYAGANTYNVFVTLLYATNDGSGFNDTTTYEYSWQLISASCPPAGTKTTTLDSTTIIGAGAGSTAPTTVEVTI